MAKNVLKIIKMRTNHQRHVKPEVDDLKVVIFSGFYQPFLGGIERYTEKLTHELRRLGYRIVIVTTNHTSLPETEKGDVTVYRLPSYGLFKNRYPLPRLGRRYRTLMNKIEQENADLVICNTRFQLTTLIGLRYAKRNNLKSLIIEHGSSHFSIGVRSLDFLGGIYEHILTRVIKHYKSTAYYGVSLKCNEWLKHFGIAARGVFYNSIDSSVEVRLPPDNPYMDKFQNKVVITYAGRILKEKGIGLLLGAFQDICNKYENVVLVVAGDGPQLPQLEAKYKQNPRIIFKGKLGYKNLMQLLGRTDIFCHPSMYPEGLPTAILEAGIMKTAVIATDRGGTKEVISDERYGIIVNESEDDLKRALEDLLAHPSQVEELKENLYMRVKQSFIWEVTARKVDKVIREAVR